MDECHICLENLDGEIAKISCGHKYHYKCIGLWINKKNTYNKNCCICENETEIENIFLIPKLKDDIKNNKISNNYQNIHNKTVTNYELKKFNIFNCCNIL